MMEQLIGFQISYMVVTLTLCIGAYFALPLIKNLLMEDEGED